jgi:gliding motility-associated-like protein
MLKAFPSIPRFLLKALLCGLVVAGFAPMAASQVVDESGIKTAEYSGVGAAGDDYAAQSFLSDVTIINKIGAWLKLDVPNSRVSLKLVGADAFGNPDVSTFLFETPLITPDPSGLFYNYGGFTVQVIPGNKYFVVVDGYQNATASGKAIVGLASVYTDTNEDMVFTTDGGLTWDTLNVGSPSGPMAIYVEGDTCTVPASITLSNPVLCPGDSLTMDAGSGFSSYVWNNGDNTQTSTITAAGNYDVTVIDPSGCLGFASVSVTLGSQPTVFLSGSQSFCTNDSLTLTAAFSSGSILWNTGSTNNSITVQSPGLYWVQVTDANNCMVADSITIFENPLPNPFIGLDAAFCAGPVYVVDAGPGYIDYLWSSGETTRSINITTTGTWICTVTDSLGCTGSSDTLNVVVYPNPLDPQIVLVNDQLQSTNADAWQWWMNNNPIAGETQFVYTPTQTGYYQVVIEDTNGCTARSDSFYKEVIVIGNFISEGFSPNGDGVNDVFFIEIITLHPENELLVFNRWGKQVFQKINYNNDWQGTAVDGAELPAGNYYFALEFRDGTSPLSGVFIINR